MLLLDQLAEDRINTAMQRGEFDNLPGTGMPLPREDLSFVPEEIRMAYKILKNSGHVPPELELRSQIHNLESTIRDNPDAKERTYYLKKLHCLYMRLDGSSQRQLNLALQDEYYEKVLARLAGT